MPTQREMLSETRKEATKNGLTFKLQSGYINNQKAYKFVDQKLGNDVITNCTIASGYVMAMSGDLSNYDPATGAMKNNFDVCGEV